MALLFMDSFDHYVTADITEKWSGTATGSGAALVIAPANGRRGSGSFRWSTGSVSTSATAYIQKTLSPADATCVCGFALQVSHVDAAGSTGIQLCSIRDGATPQVSLRLNADLTLSVTRGGQAGAALGTPISPGLAAGIFAYLELKVAIHPSAGTVEVWINGVPRLTLPGQNTRTTANTQWNSFSLGMQDSSGNSHTTNNRAFEYDDLYVLDGSGPPPWNSALGDVRVDVRNPTGPGASTGWTPSAGANWDAVNDAAPNDDTDYTSAATPGLTDTFVVQDAPAVGSTLYGVQVNLSAKKADAGVCLLNPVVRHGGTDYTGAALSPSTLYSYLRQPYATNPGTGAAWEEADFNNAEFGYTRTA